MTRTARGAALLAAAVGVATVISGCASAPPRPAASGPRYPEFTAPVVPAALKPAADVRARHDAAWERLQSGDARGAGRDYAEVLKRSPGFYPAEAGLGFVALAERQYRPAVARFRTALGRDNRYVPAWRGLVDAELGAGNDDEAIAALERLLALDATRESDRERLELLRLRQVQELLEQAARSRQAGRLDEAAGLLGRALGLAPASPSVLVALADVHVARGALDEAEQHARRAVASDPADAGAHGALGSVLEARGRHRDAAAAFERAAAIDPAWRARADAARARADADSGPAELRDLETAPTVTRGQLAALIVARLGTLVARPPRGVRQVATDVRGHWAEDAIILVIQTGLMEVYPNHTFQPASLVTRAELGAVAAALVTIASSERPVQLARWQSARPVFADLAAGHLSYRPAALAVASGAMTADAGRFQPTRQAAGAEALAAVRRIEEVAAGR